MTNLIVTTLTVMRISAYCIVAAIWMAALMVPVNLDAQDAGQAEHSRQPTAAKKFLNPANIPHTGSEQPALPLNYLVDLSDAKNHYVTVTLAAPVTGDQTVLLLPVWTPGSYMIREYSQFIDSVSVTDQSGQALDFRKVKKNRWVVDTAGADTMVFRYRVYANEMSVRNNWVGKDFAMLNGAPTFVTVVDRRKQQHHVSLKLADGWKKSASALASANAAHQFVATDYDELVDSPIVAGNVNIYPFRVGGAEHQLVNVGEKGIWDGAAAAADLAKIVEENQRLWRTVPYDRYLFINVIGEGDGGLEHDNCCLMLTRREAFQIRRRYKMWLALASHEFFHTWNVRRLRPSALANYDYENEIYTPSLWIAEGITNYYEDLILIRAGLTGPGEFFGKISYNIDSVQNKPGRKMQSLRDASFDSWVKFYRTNPNSSNTQISYYSKGAVVAFLLDAKIRESTGGRKSLDDVMRAMFVRYSDTGGYRETDFRNVASEIARTDLTPWFEHHIDSTKEMDLAPAASWYGLHIPALDTLSQIESGIDVAKTTWIGCDVDARNEVTQVEADSPATTAGIVPGDEVLAINGFRLNTDLDEALAQFNPGDIVEIVVSRRGVLQSVSLTIGGKPILDWHLELSREANQETSDRLRALVQPPEIETIDL